MMILWQERLAFLAVPKTGTTAIEAALAPHAAITYAKPPQVKHMTLQRFNRFMRPYLEKVGMQDIRTLAVMREPVSWLGSWYRYRQRDGLKNTTKSTAHLSFDDFVRAYMMDKNRPEFAEVGSQARFLAPGGNSKPVDHLFRYSDLNLLIEFLSQQLKSDMVLPQMNVSPQQELHLSPEIARQYRQKFAADFDLYASLR